MSEYCAGLGYLRSFGRVLPWWLAIAVVLCFNPPPCRAETLSESGLETVPYRLSITPSQFLTVRGIARSTARAATQGSLSYLDRPLSVVIPSAEPNGTRSHVVTGALVLEMAVARLWASGFDAGFGLGAHVYQFGEGWSAVSGQREQLPSFGGLDPLLEVGYRKLWGRTGLRALGAFYVPLGSPRALSGEKRPRGEIGLLVNQLWSRVEWGVELSFLYRPVIEVSEFAWGSQLKLAVAGRFRIIERLWAGPEFLFRPQLARQPGAHHAVLLPSVLLAALAYRTEHAQLMASYGVGLPLSRVSDEISKPRYVRAPTSPIQQLSLSLQFMLK